MIQVASPGLVNGNRGSSDQKVSNIEVSDTSLAYDRNVKLPLYARAEIPESWLIVLAKEVIEIHSQPKNGKYQKTQRLKRGKTMVSPTIPSFSCKVEDLLG